jgi:hypothetical protein
MADALGLGPSGEIRGGSSPFSRTRFKQLQLNPERDSMSQQNPNQPQDKQPQLKLTSTEDYRDGYANSVQVRMSVWDFFLVFGTMSQDNPEELNVKNFQGIYLSPQQAKALWNVLGHNLAQYENAFGSITLEQVPQTEGPLN